MGNLQTKINPLKRTAYVPQTGKGSKDPTASKYGGAPILLEGESWPACPDCGKPLDFLVQLNLESLPETPKGLPKSGMIQLFDCSGCNAWEGFTPTKLCRLMTAEQMKTAVPGDDDDATYPEKVITSWTKVEDDYPHDEEEALAKLNLTEAEKEEYFNLTANQAHSGKDKLLGWPQFVQGLEYENCPNCKKQMNFLLEIPSEHNLNIMWGDSGTAIVFYCENHPDVITLNWACT